jgi:hypothetical protein
MKIIRLALFLAATFVGSLVASAQQATTQAFVYSITGSGSMIAPGSDKAVPLVLGLPLPEGATVTTGADSTVMIQSHVGMQTGVGANSTVVVGQHSVSSEGLRTAVIDLKQGTTVSVLDPTKRAVNNYAVRTPKGVAAARGTVYQTTVELSSGGKIVVRVNTITGAVSFAKVDAKGNAVDPVEIKEGNAGSTEFEGSKALSAAYTDASGAEKNELVEAVKMAVTIAQIVVDKGGNDQTGAIAATIAAAKADLPSELAAEVTSAQQAGVDASKTAKTTGTSTDSGKTVKTTVTRINATTPTTILDITTVSPSSP